MQLVSLQEVRDEPWQDGLLLAGVGTLAEKLAVQELMQGPGKVIAGGATGVRI